MTSIKSDFAEAIRLRDLGDTVGSLAILTRLADLVDSTPKILVVLGSLYWDLPDLPKAIESFQKATELFPTCEEASLGLFHTLMESQRNDDAFDEMRRFLAVADSSEYEELLKEINERPNDHL